MKPPFAGPPKTDHEAPLAAPPIPMLAGPSGPRNGSRRIGLQRATKVRALVAERGWARPVRAGSRPALVARRALTRVAEWLRPDERLLGLSRFTVAHPELVARNAGKTSVVCACEKYGRRIAFAVFREESTRGAWPCGTRSWSRSSHA